MLPEILASIQNDRKRKKLTNIIVVAEGDEFGGANELSVRIREQMPELETRVTVLGHIQRGGAPSGADRILASRLGHAAVEALVAGRSQEMVGIINQSIRYTPFADCVKLQKPIAPDLENMIQVLAK
jgi:6-phosphofructokinase 1